MSKTHTPVTQLLMIYEYEGKRVVKLLKMNAPSTDDFIVRTLKWASNRKVQVLFVPA